MKHLLTLIILLITGCLFIGQPAFSQELRATGLDLGDEGYSTASTIELPGNKARLPLTTDLTPYCPTPRHQGDIQSCVGWATGYGALTITYAIRNNIQDTRILSDKAFSALFIYEQIRQGDCQGSGSRISDAMQLLKSKGNCLASQYDDEVENCGNPISDDLSNYAHNFRITDFLKLFDNHDHPLDKVYRMQYALSQNRPVVVGMRIRQNFFQLNESADYWWPQLGDKTPAGGHAMVVIGYDHRRGAFKLMNSWGTEWGQQGFIWIKYQVMAKFCKYAYIFQVDKELDEFWSDGQSQRDEVTKINNYPLQEMGAKLSLLFNPCKSVYCGSFTAATLNRQGLMYTTQKETWEIGQQFQLRIENTSEPVYLYIFSQNPKGRISLHWPRPESFQDGQPEAIRTRDDEDIVIPGPQRVMRISQYGTNYLVMLLSKRPLGNPIQLLRPLENSGDLLPQKLYALLASNMIPAADLHLSDHNMEIQVQTRSNRSMVPLVLRIDAKPPNHITKSSN